MFTVITTRDPATRSARDVIVLRTRTLYAVSAAEPRKVPVLNVAFNYQIDRGQSAVSNTIAYVFEIARSRSDSRKDSAYRGTNHLPLCVSRRPRAGLTSGTTGTARTAADAVQAGERLAAALAAATPCANGAPPARTAHITARSPAGTAPDAARVCTRPIRAPRAPTPSATPATDPRRTIRTIGANARAARDSSSRRKTRRAPPRRACWSTSRPTGSSCTTGRRSSRRTWRPS